MLIRLNTKIGHIVQHVLSRRKIVSKRHFLTVFSSHFMKALIIFRCIYYYYTKPTVENVFEIYFKTNIQNSFILVYFVCSLRRWYLLFKVKSGSHKISILLFSRIFVYPCRKRRTPFLKYHPRCENCHLGHQLF